MNIQPGDPLTNPSHLSSFQRCLPGEGHDVQNGIWGTCSQQQSTVPPAPAPVWARTHGLKMKTATTPEQAPPAFHPSTVAATAINVWAGNKLPPSVRTCEMIGARKRGVKRHVDDGPADVELRVLDARFSDTVRKLTGVSSNSASRARS